MLSRKQKVSCFTILASFSTIVLAEFHVVTDNWPDEHYGNSKTPDFYSAMHGKDDISSAEMAEIQKMLPEKEFERYYLRVGLSAGTMKLDDIKNTSAGAFNNASVVTEKESKSQISPEFAWGYAWEKSRAELEFLLHKKLEYAAAPVFNPPNNTENINSTVRGYTFLINGYYDFKKTFFFRPYVGFGLGLSRSQVATTLTLTSGNNVNVENKKKNFRVAWSCTAGARFRIKSRFIGFVGYRISSLGKPQWLDSENRVALKSDNILSAVTFSIAYLI